MYRWNACTRKEPWRGLWGDFPEQEEILLHQCASKFSKKHTVRLGSAKEKMCLDLNKFDLLQIFELLNNYHCGYNHTISKCKNTL